MTTAESNAKALEQKFLLRLEFFDLLKTVGAPERILTLKQVLQFLKDYITTRKLYNEINPKEICVVDDPLGVVFGTPTFTVYDVIKLLRLQMFRMPDPSLPAADPVASAVVTSNNAVDLVANAASSSSSGSNGRVTSLPESFEKRKCDNVETPVAGSSSINKRPRVLEGVVSSPMVLQIPPSPIFLSGDETEYSIQGYETAYAKDSSDDLWFLESDNNDSDGDMFEVEYEVESVASEPSNVTDTDSEIEDVMCAALFVCKDDSDIPFWADKSDDEGLDSSDDPELGNADNWTCVKCSSVNKPFSRCLKCWAQRVGWSTSRSERHPPKRRNRKLARNPSDPGYQSSQSPHPTSQEDDAESSQLSQESQSLAEKCPLCLVRPKTGVIVHGKTGHQVCCYKCARKLQSSKKRCPHCRRNIQRVIRNYIA